MVEPFCWPSPARWPRRPPHAGTTWSVRVRPATEGRRGVGWPRRTRSRSRPPYWRWPNGSRRSGRRSRVRRTTAVGMDQSRPARGPRCIVNQLTGNVTGNSSAREHIRWHQPGVTHVEAGADLARRSAPARPPRTPARAQRHRRRPQRWAAGPDQQLAHRDGRVGQQVAVGANPGQCRARHVLLHRGAQVTPKVVNPRPARNAHPSSHGATDPDRRRISPSPPAAGELPGRAGASESAGSTPRSSAAGGRASARTRPQAAGPLRWRSAGSQGSAHAPT